MAGCHLGEDAGAQTVACQDQKTGSIPVQPVDDPEGERFIFPGKIPGGRIGQSIVMVSLGGMDRHAGRFINYQKIFVFINHRKRKRKGGDFFGTFLFFQTNLQGFTGREPLGCDGMAAVHLNAVFFPQPHDHAVGIAAAF